MNEENGVDRREEEQILAALEALEEGAPGAAAESRAYLEALGMLAYGEDEVPPTPQVKAALLRAIESHPQRSAPPLAIDPEAPRRRSAWRLRIAAVFAVALLGVSAFQFVELGQQRRQIHRQEARIAELRDELATLQDREAEAPAWLASSGTELCPLEPRQAATSDSKGWLFVRQDHQHWYVAFEGLEPAPEGYVYEVWFLVDGRLVSGGTFAPGADGRAALGSPTMPTHVAGIAVTLEPDDGDASPSEEMVLYGDEVMLTL